MGRKATRRLAIIGAIAVLVGLLFSGVWLVARKNPPVASPTPAPVAAPVAPAAAEEPSPAPSAEAAHGQLKMAGQPRAFTPSSSAADDFSYSLRQERTERTILPGVTYSPSQGVNVKTADKDATIRITRDATYTTTDYQVMWHKKY